jgi:hypothetical protein
MRHLTLDTTVLHGVLRRLAMRGECEHPEALKDFFGKKRAHWEQLFDLTKAKEKSTRLKFNYTLKTDGFRVSIYLVKPKAKAAALPNRAASPDEEPVNEELVNEEPVNEELVNEEPVNEELVNEEVVNEELVNEELVNEELVNEEPVNEEIVNEELVNEEPVDLGVKSLAMSAWKNGAGVPTFADYSKKEFQERCREAEAKRRTWLAEAGLLEAMTQLPSAKTPCLGEMHAHIQALFLVLDRLLDSNRLRRVPSLRCSQHCRRQRVMSDICKRIMLVTKELK